MHYQGFERLIKKMDEIAPELGEEVVMQIGHSSFEPKNAKWFRFLEKDEDIHELIRRSRLVIAHGGAGTLMTVLAVGRPLIIVPRLQCFDEHVDDQQIELANSLMEQGNGLAILDIDDLRQSIQKKKPQVGLAQGNERLVEHIKKQIEG